MTILASAPGKLILLGEYAVLDGAPALVAAVDRRATVHIAPTGNDHIRVTAPEIDVDATGHLAADGRVHWDLDAASTNRLDLVTRILESTLRPPDELDGPAAAKDRPTSTPGHEDIVIPGEGEPDARPRGFAATLSTGAFFDEHGTKLGLGSSAALTVALTGALAALEGLPRPDLPHLVGLHRSAQSGRGSGVDIGASLTGGVVAYRTGAGPLAVAAQLHPGPTAAEPGQGARPTVQALTLPSHLRWCCVFTGRATSTPASLAHLAAWRRDHTEEYRRYLHELSSTAKDAINATRRGDIGALLGAIGEYGARLERLGRAAGLDIVGAEHRAIRNAAAACGVIYKPSGAGGGDVGVGVTRDADHMEAFRRAVSHAGFRLVDLAVDRRGLTITSD